jgi:hypothetical protein
MSDNSENIQGSRVPQARIPKPKPAPPPPKESGK